ncbi:MAG: hypothetical protein KAX53_06900 [Saprospiraceae bacterium]|nr:hypothetical protein [Saprospiraceae bacterium]
MKISLAIAKIISISMVIALFQATTLAQDINKIDWVKDLDYLKNDLPVMHSNLFFQYPQSLYNEDIEKLKKQAGHLSDEAMFIKIQQLLAKLGDSHTSSKFISKLSNTYLPIILYVYEEGIFVAGVVDNDESLIAHKLISIDGHPINNIIDSLRTLYVAENDSWHKSNIPKYLINYDLLKYFGFVKSEKVKLQLEDYYGIPKEKVVKAIQKDDIEKDEISYMRFSVRKNKRPKTNEIFSQKYFPADSLYFVIYNKCTGREDQQVKAIQDSLFKDVNEYCTNQPKTDKKSNDNKDVKLLPYFRTFRDTIFQTINTKPVKKLVFDLSNNGGGATSQGSVMIEKLAQLIDTTKTKVYVIVGRRTFSAGVIHAMELKRLLNATILGEPTGGKPSFYSGTDSRYLPSSCLQITFSRSQRKTTLDEEVLNDNTLIPDVLFPITLQSYTSGTDPIFNWILGQ